MAKRPKKTLPVTFGGSSTGKTVGRISVTVSRDNLELELADELFTDTRLSCQLEVTPKKQGKGQKSLIADQYPVLEGVFDVKGFRTNAEKFSFSLTFNRKALDNNALGEFAAQAGKLLVFDIDKIPEEDAKPQAGDEDPEVDQESEDDE